MSSNTLRLIFKCSKLTTFGTLYQPSKRFASSSADRYQHILTSKKGEKQNVGLIELHRPKAWNAICEDLLIELIDAVNVMNQDEDIAAIVLTGSEKAFAAGADIKELMGRTNRNIRECFLINNILEAEAGSKKPLIAAVNGYAFGGGCELAMMCDIIYAGDKAKFGQLEITLGIIPGGGGTQKIARSCGKSKAMEMCLTGDQITAQEAEKMGLVSRVFPADQLIAETIKLAERIGMHSPLIVQLCKESVNVAFETSLQEGLRFEKNAFCSTFSMEDRKEGMSAFIEKRKPNFKNN